MLQQMRTVGNNKWVVGVLFGTMAVSMGLFGLPSLFNGDQNVAHIGKIAVSPPQLDRLFSTELMEQSQQQGRLLTRSEGLQQGFMTNAMAKIVMRAQFQQAADNTGLVITDEALIAAIQKEKAFLEPDGKFSRAKFDMAIRQSNLTENTYLDLVRGDLAQQQIVRQINSGAILPKSIQADLGRYQFETRDASFIVLKNKDISLHKNGASDEILKDFYQKNQEQFREPEYRQLTVMSLEASDLLKDITVSEDELRAEYDRSIDTYKTEEKRSFVQILATTREQAEKIVEKAKKDNDLNKVASTLSPPLALQTFSDATAEGLTPELADAVFKTANGQFANIVQSPFGWHVILITGITKAGQQQFDKARGQITERLKKQIATEKLYDASTNFEDRVNSGDSIEKAGEPWGLKPVVFEAISAAGNPKPGKTLPKKLNDLSKIISEGFRIGNQETSGLIENNDGSYFILRVDSVTPSIIPPFDQIKSTVSAAWSESERMRLNDEKSLKIVDRLNNGETLTNVAKDLGLKIETARNVKRRSFTEKTLDPFAIDALFSLNDTVKAQRSGTEDGWVVVTMVSSKPGKAEGTAAEIIAKKSNSQMGSDMILLYQRALDQLYPIKINQTVMDRMLATY